MLDTKHIFNLTKLGKDVECLQATINTSANGIHAHLGSPLIVSKKAFGDEKVKAIRVLFPFPFKLGQSPGSSYSVDKRHLIVKNDKCFVNNNKIKVIPEFKMDNLSTLLKYVRDNGSITFNISASEYENGTLVPSREKKTAASVCSFLDVLYEMCNRYKYNSLFFCEYLKSFISSDVSNIHYTASFLDLYNCIPIFNHKKVDGVGVIFNMCLIGSTKTSGSLVSRVCVVLALSNYKDNIFVTDGIQVNAIRPMDLAVIKIIKRIVMANAGVEDKSRIKEEKEKSEITDGWLSNLYIDSSTNASTADSSTVYSYYT